MLKNTKFTTKLYTGILSILLVSMVLLLAVALIQLKTGLQDLGKKALQNTSLSIFNSLKMQNALLEEKLVGDLKVMDQEFANGGTFRLDPTRRRVVTITNQITKENEQASIPTLVLGSTVLNDNFDLVDRVQKINGGTATIFQVVEDKLLRISTNVLTKEGKRAVGTYIPSSSPVFKTVMQGETYRGKAFVVSDWYLTAYKPLKDPAGKIVAVIYVGRQILVPQLKTLLTSTTTGEDSYVFVYNSQGSMLVHPTHEGKNIFEVDQIGPLFKEHKGGFLSYRFLGVDKTAFTAYYEPWDWYLVFGMDDEDMTHGLDHKIRNSTIMVGLFILLAGALVALLLTRSLVKALNELAAKSLLVAEGDYSQTFQYGAKDAIGSLTDSLNAMVTQTREVLTEITAASTALGEASTTMEQRASNLVLGSSANGDLAERTATSAEEVRGSMQSVSAAMEQASTNINTVAIAANEMSNTIKEISP
jgi:methyl-accepting chemotaxis protein